MSKATEVVSVPRERSYEVRVAMMLAFNTSKKDGGDHDDALEAAYQAMLKVSEGQQPATTKESARLASIAPELFKHSQNLLNFVRNKYSVVGDDFTCEHMRGLAQAISKATT